MTTAIGRHALLIACLGLAAVFAVLALASTAGAATFGPSGSVCLDDASTVDPDPFNPNSPNECDGDNSPGAAASIVTTFSIPTGDAMPDRLIHFTPPQWSVAEDADVEDGTAVGDLKSLFTFGLLNGQCSTVLPVQFDLFEATTDWSDTVLFNPPNQPASFDEEQFETVDGVPRGVTEYPDYLLRILWGDDENTPLQPVSRFYGQTNVTGTGQSINIVTFEPGTMIAGLEVDPSYGYPSVVILNNYGDPENQPAPSAISDVCTPLDTSMTVFGESGGQVIRANPLDDSFFTFVIYATGQRDADDDGWENTLDVCPLDANHPGWNPRQDAFLGQPFPGDEDRDGMPDECDPLPNDQGNPGVGALNDHDGDNYYNRQDNCPLVRNNLGIEFFIQGGTSNQGDRDADGIGDDCDQNPDEPDGFGTTACTADSVVIGSGFDNAPVGGWPCGGEPPGRYWGDWNCSGTPDAVDSLLTLRHDAGLSTATGICPSLGSTVDIGVAALRVWGDADCSVAVNSIDALKLLRFDAKMSVDQQAGCPKLGTYIILGNF